MFGQDETYFLEEGLNLAPIGDYVPQEDMQQHGYNQQMQQIVMMQQQQRVRPFDYVSDALQQHQRMLQNQDFQREAERQLQAENARLRAQLEAQQQRQTQLGSLSEQDITRLAERLRPIAQPQPQLTPTQREAERRRLMEEVYGDDGPSVYSSGDSADSGRVPEPSDETFAPVPWGTDTDIKRVNVGE